MTLRNELVIAGTEVIEAEIAVNFEIASLFNSDHLKLEVTPAVTDPDFLTLNVEQRSVALSEDQTFNIFNSSEKFAISYIFIQDTYAIEKEVCNGFTTYQAVFYNLDNPLRYEIDDEWP